MWLGLRARMIAAAAVLVHSVRLAELGHAIVGDHIEDREPTSQTEHPRSFGEHFALVAGRG